jgi:HSP20 family molecular chaperone IbpA
MSKKTGKAIRAEKVAVQAEMFACLDETGENYLLEVELPGVEKKNVQLSMHDDLASIRAEREDQMFIGHLHFPMKVNPKKAQASFKQGLLMVIVPVKEKRGPPTVIKIK